MSYYRNNVSAYDTNGDGVLTVGELQAAMAADGMKNQFVIPPGNEGAHVFSSSPEALAEYKKKWLGETALMFLVHPALEKEHIDKTCKVLQAVASENTSLFHLWFPISRAMY